MDWNYWLYLDSSVGKLYWRTRPAPCVRVGAEAGTLRKDGYYQLRLKGKSYYIHKIIYEMVHGPTPIGFTVDHADRNKQNNTPSNLRLATVAENSQNQNKAKNNTSGIKGLNIHRSQWKTYWRAQVDVNCTKLIKRFPFTEEGKLEAVAWLRSQREAHHLAFANHG